MLNVIAPFVRQLFSPSDSDTASYVSLILKVASGCIYVITKLVSLDSKNSRAFFFAVLHLVVLSEQRPYVIYPHSFIFETHLASSR